MHDLTLSQSQRKNEQFKCQIRRKLKSEYMNKIRREFLVMQQSQNNSGNAKSGAYSLSQLESLLMQAPGTSNIGNINRIIINNRNSINQQIIKQVVGYLKVNFINKDERQLPSQPYFNDLIALFGNILSFSHSKDLVTRQLNLDQIGNKLFQLLQIAPATSGSLILWILYQITQINPHHLIKKVVENQINLKTKFGLSDVNLSYLFVRILDQDPKLIDGQIINGYLQVIINAKTCPYFCQNIIVIFDLFLTQNKQHSYSQSILSWVVNKLLSQNFPALAKSSLIKLLYHIISSNLNLVLLTNLISQPCIVNQLVQRGLFDTQYQNKITCIKSVNQIIKISPKTHLQELITNFPSLIQMIVSSLRLNDFEVIIQSLKCVGKIVMMCPNNGQIQNIMFSSGLKLQLQSLEQCHNKEVSNLATVFLEEYFE